MPKACYDGGGTAVEIATLHLVNEPHALSVRHVAQMR
jgi:hypothetical protein